MKLFNSDPAEGNGNPPPPAAPAAAETVITGTLDERIADLQADLQIARTERDNERGSKTKLEKDIMILQDKLAELQRLQGLPAKPAAAPAAAPVTAPGAPETPVEEPHWTETFGL